MSININANHTSSVRPTVTFILLNRNRQIVSRNNLKKMLIKLIRLVIRELKIMLLFMRFENAIFVVNALGYMCSAIVTKNNADSIYDIVCYSIKTIVYAVLYMYVHCLGNQYNGIEEDRLNKPYRPIVAGLVTPQGALHRIYIVNALYLLYSIYYIKLLPCTILWMVLIYVYSFRNFDQHYIAKWVYISLGTIPVTLNPWLIVKNVDINYLVSIAYTQFLVVICALIQDLRDVPGDLVKNRRTLPIVIGVQTIKTVSMWFFIVNAVIVVLGPALLLHYDMLQCNTRPEFCAIFLFIQFVIAACCAYRVKYKTSYDDEHITYCLFLAETTWAFYFPSFVSLKNTQFLLSL